MSKLLINSSTELLISAIAFLALEFPYYSFYTLLFIWEIFYVVMIILKPVSDNFSLCFTFILSLFLVFFAHCLVLSLVSPDNFLLSTGYRHCIQKLLEGLHVPSASGGQLEEDQAVSSLEFRLGKIWSVSSLPCSWSVVLSESWQTAWWIYLILSTSCSASLWKLNSKFYLPRTMRHMKTLFVSSAYCLLFLFGLSWPT